MDSNALCSSLDFISGNRVTLNTEQRAALQVSLDLLKINNKFRRVLYWGKILGNKNDYFIAQGVGEDELKDRKFLYSFDCLDWHLLPPATEALIADVALAAQGLFMGDPSHQYQHVEVRQQGEEALKDITVNEEGRLAVTVHTIDKEVAVVPRGAFVKSPNDVVKTNRSFEGLNYTEAGKLSNYLHFSSSQCNKSISEIAHPSIDFLDSLSKDIPKGSWSLKFEQGGRVCVLRSLLWLGLTFFHVPETPQHGYIYIGDGLKNLHLPFML